MNQPPGVVELTSPHAAAGPLVVSDDVAKRLKLRLSVFLRLARLEDTRQSIRKEVGRQDDIEMEIARQTRELQRIPDVQAARSLQEKLSKRLSALLNRDPDDAHALLVQRLMARLLQVGCQQAALFEERDQMTEALLSTAARAAEAEPLYQLLTQHDIDPRPLFGWTVYALALQRFQTRTRDKIASLQDQLSRLKKAGKKKANRTQEQSLRTEVTQLSSIQAAAQREQQAIEPVMVETFWSAYEEAAVVLIQESLPTEQATSLRAMLRYGLILQAPWMMPLEQIRELLDHCRVAITEWDDSVDVTHILYADEYLALCAQGVITQSLDEDLELNERGSERWKMDKLWRKIIHGRARHSGLTQTLNDLNARIDKITPKIEKLEFELESLSPEDEDYRQKRSTLTRQCQDQKVQCARLRRAGELIREKNLVKQAQIVDDARSKLDQMGQINAADIVRREVPAVRRVCKLSAMLKEPFLPFVLQEHYKPESGVVNTRQTLTEELTDIEKRDPLIFQDVLIPSKQPANRIYLRTSPYIILVPARGMTGLSWNPRGGTEVGRIALPLLCMRAGMITRLLYQIMADFRFDTSKESAGMDLLTSDTLVAAYAAVRWSFRKRSKTTRERAGIFNDEKDRANWRRHYRLYMISAMEGGKQLFFKSPEVYKAALKYMSLPQGVDKMG